MKLIKVLEEAANYFIGALLFFAVVGGIFAICSHLLKSEIAALIAIIFLAMFVVQLTSHK